MDTLKKIAKDELKKIFLKLRKLRYEFFDLEHINKYKNSFSFFPLTVSSVVKTSKYDCFYPDKIIFICKKYSQNETIFTSVVFDFDFNVVKIDDYYKGFLR